MKYRNKLKRLAAKQSSYDQDKGNKQGTKRPGSVNKS
jgi:hypothetical protein